MRPGKRQREAVCVRVAGLPFGVTFDITRRRIDERPGPSAGKWQVALTLDSAGVECAARIGGHCHGHDHDSG